MSVILPTVMKRIILLTLLAAALMPLAVLRAQTATIDNVWIEHGVTLNGERGMKVHTAFTVYGAQGRTIDLSINHYFIYQSDGGPVFGNADGFTAPGPNGKPQAAAWHRMDFVCHWDASCIKDSWKFIPYRVIGISSGAHDLGIVTFIRDCGRGAFIQQETVKTYFSFKIGAPQEPQRSPDVKTPRTLPCPGCSGLLKCNYCAGQGYVWTGSSRYRCGTCNGTGICQDCHGTGIWKVVYD